VDGQRRLIPLNDHEIVLYTVEGGALEWILPPIWAQATISAVPIGDEDTVTRRYVVGSDSRVGISANGRTAYVLKRLK